MKRILGAAIGYPIAWAFIAVLLPALWISEWLNERERRRHGSSS
jgi:hypothetical protein